MEKNPVSPGLLQVSAVPCRSLPVCRHLVFDQKPDAQGLSSVSWLCEFCAFRNAHGGAHGELPQSREAFDAFSQNGYLADLQALLSDEALLNSISPSPEDDSVPGSADQEAAGIGKADEIRGLYDAVREGFSKNIFIKEDNSVDMLLGNESEYSAVTAEAVYGIDMSSVSARIRDAELNGTVYLGIIENSPRKAEAVKYLNFLIQKP